MITVRVMSVSDYDAVHDLRLHTPGMGLNSTDDSREGIEKYLQRNPATSFVAEDSDRLVGVIMAGYDGRRGYIFHTAVLPAYRRQGIAHQLVDCAMSALEAEGISKAALVTFMTNADGNGFWEHLGFSTHDDLIYRNKNIRSLEKINT